MNTQIIIIIIIIVGLLILLYKKIDKFTPAVITQLTARGGMDERITGLSQQKICMDPLYQLDLPLKKSQDPYGYC